MQINGTHDIGEKVFKKINCYNLLNFQRLKTKNKQTHVDDNVILFEV